MFWRRKEPGHHHPWYWLLGTGMIRFPHVKGKSIFNIYSATIKWWITSVFSWMNTEVISKPKRLKLNMNSHIGNGIIVLLNNFIRVLVLSYMYIYIYIYRHIYDTSLVIYPPSLYYVYIYIYIYIYIYSRNKWKEHLPRWMEAPEVKLANIIGLYPCSDQAASINNGLQDMPPGNDDIGMAVFVISLRPKLVRVVKYHYRAYSTKFLS